MFEYCLRRICSKFNYVGNIGAFDVVLTDFSKRVSQKVGAKHNYPSCLSKNVLVMHIYLTLLKRHMLRSNGEDSKFEIK